MQPFLYQLWYLVFSLLGNYNYFFFAAHLLDVAVGVAALRIILEAITYNGKQLMLTVFLLTIVVYIYTVVAFNFFRKFYVSGFVIPRNMCRQRQSFFTVLRCGVRIANTMEFLFQVILSLSLQGRRWLSGLPGTHRA